MQERELHQGDGLVNLLPNEIAVLRFRCRDCDRDSSVTIIGRSQPTPINCDEERQCVECEKTSIVRLLKEGESTIPEEKLMEMTRDQLLSLLTRNPKS